MLAAAVTAVALSGLLVQPRASAEDLYTFYAATDQPRINIAFAPFDDPTNPYVGLAIDPRDPELPLVPNIDVQGWANAYFDTGASGIVLSPSVANALGIPNYQIGGTDVIFNDVSPGGYTPFNLSEQVAIRIAPSPGIMEGDEYFDYFTNPANFLTTYTHTAPSPARLMIGPVDTEGDINVIGMPVMMDKKVVWDPRPTDNARTLWPLDEEDLIPDNYDVQMRSYLYEADHVWTGTPTLLDQGIPTWDKSIRLSYANFSEFTTIEPVGADGPSFVHNPFIGPNPLGAQEGDPPPVRLRYNGMESSGSWLLDTGAGASFVSEATALDLGIQYDPAHPPGPPLESDPQLLGIPLSRQFQVAITGISGETILIAGFYADELIVPTEQGAAGDPDDPNHLHYVATPGPDGYGGAAVLVLDIALEHPETGEIVTLDGIFGMNFLVASVEIDFSGIIPLPYDFRASPFDAIVFDERAGRLYLSMADGQGWPVPEPAGAGLALLAGLGLLARRRR